MHLFYRRPLAAAACLFSLAAVLLLRLPSWSALLLLAVSVAAALLFAVLLFRRRSARILTALLCSMALLLSSLSSYLFFHVRYAAVRETIGAPQIFSGTVISRDRALPYASFFTVSVSEWNGEAVSLTLRMECEYASALSPGDRFEALGTLRETEITDAYDEETELLSNGILGVFTVAQKEDCRRLERSDRSLRVLLSELRERLSYRLSSAIGGEEGRLASALLLGNREAPDDRTILAFRRTGVSHLLALSGLHISILIGIFDGLLRRLRVAKLPRLLAVSVAALLYLLLTGCALSTLRALLMLFLLYAGFLLRGDYDSFTGLSLSLAGILFVTPYAVTDIGMWMSYLAAGSIVIFSPALSAFLDKTRKKSRLPTALRRRLEGILSALFVGIVANLGLMLLQALVFGEISLVSVPVTLLLSLPTACVLFTSLFALLFPFLAPLAQLPAKAMLLVTDAIADTDGLLVSMKNGWVLAGLVLLTLLLILLAVTKQKRPLLWGLLPVSLAFLVTTLSMLWGSTWNRSVQIDYLRGGKGEILLVGRGAHAVAFDFSEGGADEAYALSAVASERGATELELLVITHYHNMTTHFLSVLTSRIRVQEVFLPPPQTEEEQSIAIRIREEAERCGIKITEVLDEAPIEGVTLLAASHDRFERDRHPALLYAVATEEKRLVYCSGSVAESELRETAGELFSESDYVIVGKTGSPTAGNRLPPFSDEIECLSLASEKQKQFFYTLPKAEIISVGAEWLTFPMN